jgi:competence protein ComEC
MERSFPPPSACARFASIGILLGVAAHSIFFHAPFLVGWSSLLAALVCCFRRKWLFVICFCCFAVGWLQFAFYIRPLEHTRVRLGVLQRLEGRLASVSKNDYGQTLSLEALRIFSGDFWETVQGMVSVSVPVYPPFGAGETIEVLCSFHTAEPPRVSPLRRIRHRVIGFCDDPLTVNRIAAPSFGDRFFASLRQRIAVAIGRSLPSPHAELASGIVFGSNQTRLPADVLDAFRRTGTTHIVAASGYNVSVVSSWFLAFAFLLGFRRRAAFACAGGLVWFYVCIAGFGASLLRAAVMISAVLCARMLGRETESTHILLLTAAGMVIATPTLLGFDIGFQLTVAATVGLVVLGPRISSRLSPWIGVSTIPNLFSETIAVLLTTTPILLWQFGTFSTISLVANILIVPVVPFIMMLSVAVLGTAILLPATAPFVGLLVLPPLSYLIATAHALADLPFASVAFGNFPFVGVLLWYAVLLLLFHPSPKSAVSRVATEETKGWEIVNA